MPVYKQRGTQAIFMPIYLNSIPFNPMPHMIINWASIMYNFIVLSTAARFRIQKNHGCSSPYACWGRVGQLFSAPLFLPIYKAYLFSYLLASWLKKFQTQITKHCIALLVWSDIMKFNKWNPHTMDIFRRIFRKVNQEIARMITRVEIHKRKKKSGSMPWIEI